MRRRNWFDELLPRSQFIRAPNERLLAAANVYLRELCGQAEVRKCCLALRRLGCLKSLHCRSGELNGRANADAASGSAAEVPHLSDGAQLHPKSGPDVVLEDVMMVAS
jgi:hypothetical protein